MTYMLCYNKVEEFGKWKEVFDSHKSAHRQAGLHLYKLWQDVSDPNSVFFIFSIDDLDKANEFLNSPHSAQAGKDAGVVEGYFHFVKEIEIY